MLIRCNMAISAKKGKSRVIKKVLHYFIFVNIVSKLVPCRGSIELQSKAFMNGAEEELYNSGRPFQESLRYESPSFNSDIFFNPPFMDYGSRPIGMPFVQQIMVHNTNPQLSLHLLSISGSSPHFHCSFFEDKLVAPMGNTTFEICFLAQNLGQIKTTLYIHSSRGSFKYHVSGEGTQNPYRIRPVLGARVPINSSFSPVIHLYNPHGSVLQVQEIYSSGSDLHLELPSGQIEATKDMWEIPPYETKPIMKANFLGRVENNHTAFIRIKTNKESKEEMLVVPMEVEVTSSQGLFSVTEMLDFGILRTFDENASLKLEVLNSKSQSIHITNVTVEPPNEAVEIDFVPVEVKYDIFNPTGVALVTFQASKAVSLKECSGHIVLRSADSLQTLQIPYQAQVFFGDLEYNKSLYFYGVGNNESISHSFPIKNLFQHPLVIFNVSLGAQAKGVFSVLNFSRPVLIRPGEELLLLTLMFHPERADLHFNTEMILHTNLSLFSVSVIVYNGKLQVYHDSNYLSGYLNFGTLAIGEKRSLNFTVLNNNPINIMISKFYTNFDGATVELLHIGPKNGQHHRRTAGPCSAHSSCQVLLSSYHEAAFRLKVKAPELEGSFRAEVVMETEDELLLLTFNLQTSIGNILIDPSKLVFHQCFPGKIVWMDLRVNSSFQRDLRLQDVSFASNDPRFKFIPRTHHSIIISPNKESLLGKLYFDLLQGSMQDYYLALSMDASVGHSWLLSLTLNGSAVEVDILLYLRSRHKFTNLLPSEKISNITMQLNTDHIKGFLFNLQAHLSWPTLLNQSKVSFPLTQIGSQTSDWFTIENPSNLPLLLHIVPDFIYPDVQQLIASIGSNFLTKEELYEDESFEIDVRASDGASNPFVVSSILDSDSMKAVGVEPHITGIHPSANTSVILLHPGRRVSVQLIFHPKDEERHSSIFIIRNNLTVIELVRVQGQGGKGDLRLSNRRPGSTKPLSFEMSDKHMKLCEKGSISKGTQPNFSIKRSFTLHNLGQLPVTIHSFEISGRICEGFGFKVLDCTPLTLHANESKKLSIIFTPDFGMSKVRQVLILRTRLVTEMEFVLQVNIPGYMISKCASVLPRPLWEPMMFYCIVVLMAFVAVCIVMAAYYESNQILSNELHRLRSEQLEGYYDRYKVFDLRLCTSNETPKCINRKVLSQETFSTSSLDAKAIQSSLSAPSPSRLLVGQKPSKSSTSLVSFLSDIYQGLKVSFFNQSNHKKTSTEPKKKNENSKFSFCFWNILNSKNVEKIQNPKKEELSPTQVRNNLLLQRRADAEGILTLRKNKRQKNFLLSNKPLDILADAGEKVFMKNKNEAGSRSFKQDARKGLINEMKLPDKNDDSSSTATDTSSLENDDKNILTEYLQTKRDKTKVTKSTAPIKIINADEHTGRTTSHSPKRKLSKEAEDNAKIRTLPKQEGTKVKTSTNPLRGKRKSNTPYCGSSSQNNARPQSKSPTPAWDSPSTNGDDLSDIVNQTSNFAKLKTVSLTTDKQSKCSHPPPSEASEIVASTSSNTVKPLKTSTHVANEASLPMSSLSNFGGRPVAAVGATIRRPWTQANSPSMNNDINSTFKGSSTSSIQNITPDPFLTNTHLLNNSSASRSDFKAASNSKELIHNDYLEPINSFKPPIEKHDAMMQTLLAERRKRLLEYQKKMLISEWSGIGKSAAPTQQPWNDYSGYWSSQSCLPNGISCMSPLTPRYDMFGPSPWSNYKPTEESNWMSPSSLWRSEPLKLGSQDNDSYAIFDPFNTLENNGSIWNPTSTGSNINNGWDMSSSPNKPSDK